MLSILPPLSHAPSHPVGRSIVCCLSATVSSLLAIRAPVILIFRQPSRKHTQVCRFCVTFFVALTCVRASANAFPLHFSFAAAFPSRKRKSNIFAGLADWLHPPLISELFPPPPVPSSISIFPSLQEQHIFCFSRRETHPFYCLCDVGGWRCCWTHLVGWWWWGSAISATHRKHLCVYPPIRILAKCVIWGWKRWHSFNKGYSSKVSWE